MKFHQHGQHFYDGQRDLVDDQHFAHMNGKIFVGMPMLTGITYSRSSHWPSVQGFPNIRSIPEAVTEEIDGQNNKHDR